MSSESVESLAALIGAQGLKVKELKVAKGPKDEIDVEVGKLLELKQKITALDPSHALALVEKKKKKEGATTKKKEPEGPSKKDLRKQERAKKAAEVEFAVDEDKERYGDAAAVESAVMTDRSFTHLSLLTKAKIGQKVWVRARTHTTRGKGSLIFLVARQGVYTCQCVAAVDKDEKDATKGLVTYVSKLSLETIVDIEAVVESATVATCSQKDVELKILKIFAVSKALPELPFQIADASRNENDEKSDLVTVGLDLRLNHRCVDLRTPASQAIMRIKSKISLSFATFLDAQGFVGVQSPKLLGGSSEGGSSVFSLEYFGKPACLAQSPQLYKQMLAACSDFEKVYEIGPVFRAEDSNTRRHLCEFTGLDLEMSIYEHYYEVLDLFSKLMAHIFETIETNHKAELEIISQVYPFEPFLYLKEAALRLTFAEGIALLREAGVGPEKQGDFDDLSTENEKLLGDIVLDKYKTDFFIMDKYPLSIRPFYTQPDPTTFKDPKCPPHQHLSNSFDMFMRGQEITSGAQRIHDHKLLMDRVIFCHKSPGHGGPKPESIQAYLDAFKYGAYPHGGGGIGLERVAMLYLNLSNIRKVSMFPRDPSRLAP